MAMSTRDSAAAVAAHRFGLGEASLAGIGSDPQGWLAAQVGPADTPRGEGLLDTTQALAHIQAALAARRAAKRADPAASSVDGLGRHDREVMLADARSRLLTAAATQRPFAERLHLFWANHFTVSLAKGAARGLVGAFERDAIRPHIAGPFDKLLWASSTHPAMLRYLDNQQSAGPRSRIVGRAAKRAERMQERPRLTGLNENFAREILELHTLGVNGGYTQADVTAFAAVLTGWRVARGDGFAAGDTPFDPDWHEPGRKTVLGRSYAEGPEALGLLLRDLARHPSTARFVSTKLARHVVADDPPAALVDRLVQAWRRSDGQLAEVTTELLRSPEAWEGAPAKLRTPEEFVVSTARLLRLDQSLPERRGLALMLAGGVNTLGQRVQAAPSPAGWPDRAEEWLGPEAVWKRIEWSARVGERLGRTVDARALAEASLGPRLSDDTRTQIARAADGPQALALLLMSPEFQRR